MKKMMMIVGCVMAFAVWADLDYLHFAVGQDPAAVVVTFASQPDSRGFSWQTTQEIASGEVAILAGAFGEGDDAAFDAADRRIAARVVAADDDGRPVNVFQAKAYGLAAGGYSYRLGSAGHYVYGTFTVKDAPSALTIVNLSDAQTRQAPRLWKWERTCKAVRDFVGNEKIDFIVHGGDHLDGSFLEAGDNTVSAEDTGHCRYFQWAIATEAMNQYLAGVPVIWSSGNHDYYKGYDFTAEDWSLTNTTTYGCHSFDYGSVHIVSIPFSSENKSVDNDTLAWLEADLQANRRAKWTVLSLHAGPYTTGDNMRSVTVEPAIKGVSALCARYRVDLVLQAHDHTSSKTRPYRWDAAGYTTDENDDAVVNLAPAQALVDGEIWDVDSKGTYYVSAGCSGHRIGELSDYADRDGKDSYTQRVYKVVTGTIAVDSDYARKGDDASKDVGHMMFGVLRITENRLTYDWYAVSDEGVPTLYDSLKVMKGASDADAVSNGTDFSGLPAGAVTLDPLADDAGAKPTEYRYWSYEGTDTSLLPLGGAAGSRYLAMTARAPRLRRNFNALSSADAMNASPREVPLAAKTEAIAEATVKFTVAKDLPEIDESAGGDKLAVFVLDDGGRKSLCALGGFVDATEGLVQKLYAFNLAIDDAWLAKTHRLSLETYAEGTTDGRHAGILVSVDGRVLSVAGAADGYLGAVTPARKVARFYAARQMVLSLKEGAGGRSLKGLAFSGRGELHRVRLSCGPRRPGTLIIVR